MPVLESLDIVGRRQLVVSRASRARRLSLDLSGAAEIRGAASRFDALTLDMSGAGNADLGDVPVTDADVDLQRRGNVTLRMAGGRLTGDMSGASNLEYYGTVSEQSVDKSGFGQRSSRD